MYVGAIRFGEGGVLLDGFVDDACKDGIDDEEDEYLVAE